MHMYNINGLGTFVYTLTWGTLSLGLQNTCIIPYIAGKFCGTKFRGVQPDIFKGENSRISRIFAVSYTKLLFAKKGGRYIL